MRKSEESRIQALMAEGYQEMAEENRLLAEESFPLISEAIAQYTQWGEDADG